MKPEELAKIQENNMNYELAKQLRDVGFEFKSSTIKNGIEEIRLAIPTVQSITKYLDTNLEIVRFADEWFFVPTLSELIEACGEDFEYLRNMEDGTFECGYWWTCECEREWRTESVGKTPEEAVANLYLSLRSKTLITKQ